MKKLITLSVYGTNPRYIVGAHRQISLAWIYYNDWTVRVYTDNPDNFVDCGPNVEVVHRTDVENGVFWRFEPLFESDDNITMVRDSDGRMTMRECAAVHEWLDSGKKFHTFRDHEAHFQYPIIACAFAMRGKLDEKIRQVMDEKFVKKPFYYTNDQVFLRDYVWPAVKDDSMVHEMSRGWFGLTRETLDNPYAFCGNGWDENDMPLYPPSLAEMAGWEEKRKSLSADANFFSSLGRCAPLGQDKCT